VAHVQAAGLAELTDAAAGPVMLEDVDTGIDEAKLFHLYNLVQERGGFLLMTATRPVAAWGLTLADLKSRMGAVQIVTIREPDDGLFAAVLVKLFADRQLAVAPDVLHYLTARLERSFVAARRVVSELDSLSLAGKRAVTVPLVRELLENSNNNCNSNNKRQ
jgi:chromosomal replication initiation ATPase DnaA